MSKDSGRNELRLKIEPSKLGMPKSIILNLINGMTVLPFSSDCDSLVLEY